MGQLPSQLRQEIATKYNPAAIAAAERPFEDFVGYIQDLPAVMDAFVASMHVGHGSGQDDRKLLLEKLITWMAHHPDSNLSMRFEQVVIDLLYKDLPHPPAGYVALPLNEASAPLTRKHKHVTYAYRSADGSNYNILYPSLGKAGMPYARSVASEHPLPPAFLPDAGLVFDLLLKRDKFTPHPGGVSSLFFAFADLVIHSLFNTNRQDITINDSSSYLDLSPLYGSSEHQTNSIRREDGTGKLWDDVFADSRLLIMPPSACSLLILLSRNHNYIADKLYHINEKGTFKSPASLDEESRKAQDEEIFQRARLVNCGFFMQIILADYVGTILGLTRDGLDWRLKVREPMRRMDHTVSPRGEGNVVSVEFNLMYRWHATLSEHDSEWIESEMQTLFPGKDLSKLSPKDFGAGYVRAAPPADVRDWTFGGLKRDSAGRFANADIAKILLDSTAASASAFKARGIPEALRVVELMGIQQARKWGTCSLNEFRQFMGLKAYESFAEWNPDPDVHQAAEALYQNIDNLELYVGLQAEEAKKPTPGAGLCPGYTMSRAILSDAVCLTRGDRFMTIDFSPETFTAWGYQDCQIPQHDGSYGGMLTKLLFRTLPEFYPPGSAYAHFPFMVPERVKESMEKRGDPVDDYTWTRPTGPQPVILPPVDDTKVVAEIREEHQDRMKKLVGRGFQREPVEEVMLAEDVEGFFSRSTRDLMDAKAIGAIGSNTKYVDVARDVINATTLKWVQSLAPIELKASYVEIADCIYVNSIPENECVIFNKAKPQALMITKRIEDCMRGLSQAMSGSFSPTSPVGTFNTEPSFILALRNKSQSIGRSPEDIAADFLGDVIATAPLFARAVVRALEYVLSTADDETVAMWQDTASQDTVVILTNLLRDAVYATDDIGVRIGLMSYKFIETAAVTILRTILSYRNLGRAPGQSGQLKSLTGNPIALGKEVYINEKGEITPWPSSLMLQYQTTALLNGAVHV